MTSVVTRWPVAAAVTMASSRLGSALSSSAGALGLSAAGEVSSSLALSMASSAADVSTLSEALTS